MADLLSNFVTGTARRDFSWSYSYAAPARGKKAGAT